MESNTNKPSEIKQLYSGQEKEVFEALTKIRDTGNESIINALIDLLVTTQNKDIYEEICKILNDLKNQGSVEFIIHALKDEKTKNHRHILVSALWQSSVNSESYLKELTDTAVENDFITCLECLTVIENMLKPAEEDIIYSLKKVDEGLLVAKDDKKNLLFELKEILKNFLFG